MTIDVKDAADQTLVHEVVRRDLNLIQFAAGFLYLWPLWFWSWKYDKKIEIYVPTNVQKSNWDAEPSKSKWD